MVIVSTIVVLLAVFLLALIQRRRQQRQAVIYYSRVTALQTPSPSFRSRLADLPNLLMFVALACFLLALLNLHMTLPPAAKQTPTPGKEEGLPVPTEGIAIYLLLDQSGSMKQRTSPNGPTKIELLKQVTRNFIEGDEESGLEGRRNDLIGLIAFARAARVLSPLTLDHAELLKQLDSFGAVTSISDDGTGIGYAIFKTVNMITATRHFAEDLVKQGKPAYTIKNAVLVVVTDGFQEPNPADQGKWMRTLGLEEAADYALENGVKIYFVNIDPIMAQSEFAPHRHLLERITSETGGRFFMATLPGELQTIYRNIDTLEKSTLPVEDLAAQNVKAKSNLINTRPLFPLLIAFGLFALGLSLLLSTTLLRQVP